eukprot:7538871-Pyramimonas_sp.AAC.1
MHTSVGPIGRVGGAVHPQCARTRVFVASFARTNQHVHDSRPRGPVTDRRVFLTPTAPDISQSYSPGPLGERNGCHVC